MVKKGIVRKVIADKILVEIINDTTQCNYKCDDCKLKDKLFLVETPIPVRENDVVELFVENYKLFMSIFVTFILPLILFIIGIFLGKENEIKGLLIGGIFVAFALIFAYIFDKHFKARIIVSKVLF